MSHGSRKVLLVIDGPAYVHRSFHAIRHLTSPDGRPTNAVYGFTRMLLKLLKEEQPEYMAVAFDVSRETFRNDLYPAYKATRKETPTELIEQTPIIQDIIRSFGIEVVAELRKVVWPARKEVTGTTTGVLVFVFAMPKPTKLL